MNYFFAGITATFLFFAIGFQIADGNEDTISLPLSFKDAMLLGKERHVDAAVSNERFEQSVMRLGQPFSVLLPHLNATASQESLSRNLQASGITFPPQPTPPASPPPAPP